MGDAGARLNAGASAFVPSQVQRKASKQRKRGRAAAAQTSSKGNATSNAISEKSIHRTIDEMRGKANALGEQSKREEALRLVDEVHAARLEYLQLKSSGPKETIQAKLEELGRLARSMRNKVNRWSQKSKTKRKCASVSHQDARGLFLDDTSLGSISSASEAEDNGADNAGSIGKAATAKPRAAAAAAAKTCKKKKEKKWWKSLTDIDPITVEHISDLAYPPFGIHVATERGEPITHYFDGKYLAEYIVSTGNFLNPNNRQPLTRKTLRRLDEYLEANRLPRANVTDAFDLSKTIRQRGGGQHNEQARRDATVLTRNLFNWDRTSAPTPGEARERHRQERRQDNDRSRRQQHGYTRSRLTNASLHQEGNLAVFDDSTWEERHESVMEDTEEFPAMPSGTGSPSDLQQEFQRYRDTPPSTAPPAGAHVPAPVVPAAPSWVARGSAGAGRGVPPDQRAFPPFGSGGGGAAPASNWRSSSSTIASVVSVGRRDAAAVDMDDEHRPKLVLKPRSAPRATPLVSLNPTSSSSSAAAAAASTSRAVLPKSSREYLCPYLPQLVQRARTLGLNWVAQMERDLALFVRGNERTRDLGPMKASERKFVHSFAKGYFGLDTKSVDPEPRRHLILYAVASAAVPEVSITNAFLDFSDLMELQRPEFTSSYKGPGSALSEPFGGPDALTRQSSSASASSTGSTPRADEVLSAGVGLWGVTLRGPGSHGRVTSADVTEALDPFVRSSAYFVSILDNENVLLEFQDRTAARKTFGKLREHAMGGSGRLGWKALQWWPAPIEWARYQLALLKGGGKAKEAVAKPERVVDASGFVSLVAPAGTKNTRTGPSGAQAYAAFQAKKTAASKLKTANPWAGLGEEDSDG